MNPVAGLIIFAIGLVLFLYLAVGFLGSMGDASHVFQDGSDQKTVNASSEPKVVQVSPRDYGIEKDSENISVNSQSLTEGTNYSVVSYSTGKFNITDLSGSGEKTLDFSYRYETDSQITGEINATGEMFKAYSSVDFMIPLLILGATILWGLAKN